CPRMRAFLPDVAMTSASSRCVICCLT
ncbi:MAG: hypothetical protein AVDCRST_MAG87-1097, partial [uncultured Thermomicrobiales bacterium]